VGQRAHYFPLLSVSKLLCTLAKTKKEKQGLARRIDCSRGGTDTRKEEALKAMDACAK